MKQNQPIKQIGVIGSGFMGTEIASRALLFGHSVNVFDIDTAALSKSQATIEAFIQAKIHHHVIKEELTTVQQRIAFHQDLTTAVKGADLIIEAIAENLEVKRKLFGQLDELLPPPVILATNSSSIPISRIETNVKHKDRVLNMHFYAPIEKMNFVELMRGSDTSALTVKRATDWLIGLDCLPMVCQKESIGFIFNRVWHAARREAMKVWQEGVADYQDIDRAWMLFSGMPFGPFALMDLIGLDIVYNVQNLYFEDSKNAYFKPPRRLKEMVDCGDLGIKSGRGFYNWPEAECLQSGFLTPDKPD